MYKPSTNTSGSFQNPRPHSSDSKDTHLSVDDSLCIILSYDWLEQEAWHLRVGWAPLDGDQYKNPITI